jgi:hypothetical protein
MASESRHITSGRGHRRKTRMEVESLLLLYRHDFFLLKKRPTRRQIDSAPRGAFSLSKGVAHCDMNDSSEKGMGLNLSLETHGKQKDAGLCKALDGSQQSSRYCCDAT